MKTLHDTWLVFQRHLLLMARSPLQIALGIAQPVVYLALFAPLLKPALSSMGAGSMADAYRIYVPGMLVALALGGGLYVGFGLLAELGSGVIERARVTPVSRVALLLGRSLRDVVTLAVQAAMIIVLALPLGLAVRLQDLLLAYLLLALISLSSAAISYGLALRIGNPDTLGQVVNNLAQPLMLLSGTLLPLALAPLWLRRVADWNPFSWAVTGMRELFAGHPGDAAVGRSLALMAAVALAALIWSARQFARAVR
ncbi:ABC transporter permease [Streptomyces sp. TLI_171]|uniref:ABC transporter permease n=1 Tax=Streptomyces sp. TLI_171 TaxID=1938859 RepID=UPI000C175021|nr:ABC transporter permease [Streptomyces sp. TLI_171]RKE23377.1 ABC-2 type transport system permease protein [Streptomyces sp. TLI_171]